MMSQQSLLIFTCYVYCVYGLTHPLPDEESKIMNDQIKCATGKEFLWERTDPAGKDIKITYRCGDSPAQTKTYTCKNGYKASSKRDILCDPGPDPNFGIFREGKDPNIMDTARIIYFCMKESVNSLPRC